MSQRTALKLVQPVVYDQNKISTPLKSSERHNMAKKTIKDYLKPFDKSNSSKEDSDKLLVDKSNNPEVDGTKQTDCKASFKEDKSNDPEGDNTKEADSKTSHEKQTLPSGEKENHEGPEYTSKNEEEKQESNASVDSVEYWKQIAEERRIALEEKSKALEEALREIIKLREEREVLEADIETLRNIAEAAKDMAAILDVMVVQARVQDLVQE